MGFRKMTPEGGGTHMKGGSKVREAEMESPVGPRKDFEGRQGQREEMACPPASE